MLGLKVEIRNEAPPKSDPHCPACRRRFSRRLVVKTRHAGNGELVLQGNVEVRQVNLGFKVSGRIETLNVDEGDRVRTGQVLASLEKIYFEDTLAQMRAQLGQSEANYTKLKAGNRRKKLRRPRPWSRSGKRR